MQAVEELEKIETAKFARKKFSVAETRKMMEVGILPEESGWELINGEIIRLITIGSKHVAMIIKLCKLFERKYGDVIFVSAQNPVHIDEHNEPEPDIALLKPRDDFYAENLPVPTDVLLVVEISDSTLGYDREVKKNLYATAGIPEFWLVNLKENNLEVYSQPKNGAYHLARILEKGEVVKSETIENLVLNVEEILGV